MKKILTGIFILTIILLLIGCQKAEAPTQPTGQPTETPLDTETEISAGIGEIEEMDKDLITSDLDNVEKDLAEIDW